MGWTAAAPCAAHRLGCSGLGGPHQTPKVHSHVCCSLLGGGRFCHPRRCAFLGWQVLPRDVSNSVLQACP